MDKPIKLFRWADIKANKLSKEEVDRITAEAKAEVAKLESLGLLDGDSIPSDKSEKNQT